MEDDDRRGGALDDPAAVTGATLAALVRQAARRLPRDQEPATTYRMAEQRPVPGDTR